MEEKNIIETVVQLRKQFNEWWTKNVNFENSVFVISVLYLLNAILYVYVESKEGRKEKDRKAGLKAIWNTIGCTFGVTVGIIVVIFLLPESKFTLLSYIFLEQHPNSIPIFLGILIGGGFIAYIGAMSGKIPEERTKDNIKDGITEEG